MHLVSKAQCRSRFNATHQERFGGLTETDLLAPMLDLSFQTYAGVNVGIVYSHGFLSDEQAFPGTFGGSKFEGDIDSVGGYLAKQWDCGFKVGATVAYSTADLRYENGRSFYDFDIVGTSVALGYARSFGEKKFGRNVFVDTSANFLYQSEEDAFYFLWMAKVGHSFSERFAAYGIFNLFHVIDFNGNYVIPEGYVGYHPFGDETWGETGAGFQAQLCHGFTFTAEATTPVLDEQFVATDSFQVRAGLNWRF